MVGLWCRGKDWVCGLGSVGQALRTIRALGLLELRIGLAKVCFAD